MISKVLAGSADASAWWMAENACETVKKLVVVIDELGKAPDFARGFVDEVRTIYAEISKCGLAQKVLLVLVGSGFEHHIREERVLQASVTVVRCILLNRWRRSWEQKCKFGAMF